MKKLLAVITLLSILLIGLTISRASASRYPDLFMPMPGQGSASDVTYILEAPTKHILSEEKIYKAVPPNVTPEKLQTLAKKFDINGQVSEGSQKQTLEISDDHKQLSVSKNNGFFTYVNKDTYENLDIVRDNIPSDDKCMQIAKGFLTDRDLLPKRFEIIKVSHTTSGSPLTNDEKLLSSDVYFYPTLNEKPVYGVSRIIVTVGNNGEIEAVSKYYKDVEYMENAKLKSPDKALSELKAGKSSNSLPEQVKDVKIKKVAIGYWEDVDAELIQPVYAISGNAEQYGKTITWDAFLPAIDNVELSQEPDLGNVEFPKKTSRILFKDFTNR